MPDSDQVPEGAATWRPNLSAEGEAHVDSLRATLESRIRLMRQLREALGLSDIEFLELMLKDEFEGLPPNVPRPALTLSKLQTFVEERGGTFSLTITFGDTTFEIPQ